MTEKIYFFFYKKQQQNFNAKLSNCIRLFLIFNGEKIIICLTDRNVSPH